jgi:hypothetical protein
VIVKPDAGPFRRTPRRDSFELCQGAKGGTIISHRPVFFEPKVVGFHA